MGTLSITRKSAGAIITAAGFNTNYDEIEAVINGAIDSTNIAADAVTATELGDIIRDNYGVKQHTDGSIYIDLASTSGLEFSSGQLRIDAYGISQITSNGLEIGRTGDCLLSSHASTPDGYTDITSTYSARYLRVGSTGLSTGGASTHTHTGTTDGHTLTTAEIPAHTHTQLTGSAGGGSYAGSTGYSSGVEDYDQSTGSAGGGGAHTHGFTTAAGNNAPLYVDLKLLQKI